MLISAGARSRWVLVLITGRAKIVASAAGGRDAVLAVRGPGDIIGEMAAVDGAPRSATAMALDPVRALWLSAERFTTLLAAHPGIGTTLLRIITDRLRYANQQRADFADRPTAHRIAAILTELADRYGRSSSEGVVIALRVSQRDLAGLVSASREAVARALRTLREHQVVSTGRQRIVIHRPEELRRLAELPPT